MLRGERRELPFYYAQARMQNYYINFIVKSSLFRYNEIAASIKGERQGKQLENRRDHPRV